MSTPEPPDQWGQAWSEEPPTQQFSAQGPYGAPVTPDPAYSDPAYSDQSYLGQATQQPVGPEYYAQQPPMNYGPPPSRTPVWAWVLLAVVLTGLFGGLGYFAVTQLTGSNDPAPAATRPVTDSESTATTAPRTTASVRPSPTAVPRQSIPSNALACPGGGTAALSSSAVVGATSCPFAEEVRKAYLGQSKRNATVSVQAWSPITKQWYTMSCTGSDVVKCSGGNEATVYVY